MNQETLNLSATALAEYNRTETIDLKDQGFTSYCLNELTHKEHLKYIYEVLQN